MIIHNPISAFCDEDYCYGEKNGVIIYFNDDHLNDRGAAILTDDLIKKVFADHK